MKNEKIIIIGGVAGGATAAARLRRLSERYEIIMFEKDEYVAFANCGLPYYIGGVITERKKLIVQSVAELNARYNIDVRVKCEVIKIIPESKQVLVFDHTNSCEYYETYDKVILSPGASPIVPNFPSIKEVSNCFTIRNIPDTDLIYNYITLHSPNNAVVIGAGFIGLEMAENLSKLGMNVTIIDSYSQVLSNIDKELACLIELELKKNGVSLHLNTNVSDISLNGILLNDGRVIKSDLTILAVGVKPNSSLAVEMGMDISASGGIIVNNRFETSIHDIYAIGDVISVKHFLGLENVMVPLAWPANRQARLVADIIFGMDVKYTGVLGTSILKVFELECATTGYSEKLLKMQDIEYKSIIAHRSSHASYYPGAALITLKLLFDLNGKILGACAIGKDGVDKRIDVIATAIKSNLSVYDLEDIEICYAPPFSSAKDPVNIAGYAAVNILNGLSKTIEYFEVSDDKFIVDVRTSKEFERGHIKNAINIDIDTIRDNLDLFPNDVKIYVYCMVGLRGYVAERILRENGFNEVYNLSGGYLTYKSYIDNLENNKGE